MKNKHSQSLADVAVHAHVWRRLDAEAKAARRGLDLAIGEAVAQGNTQRDVAQAAEMTEPLIRRILALTQVEQ